MKLFLNLYTNFTFFYMIACYVLFSWCTLQEICAHGLVIVIKLNGNKLDVQLLMSNKKNADLLIIMM